jgi:hypothetical protein
MASSFTAIAACSTGRARACAQTDIVCNVLAKRRCAAGRALCECRAYTGHCTAALCANSAGHLPARLAARSSGLRNVEAGWV